MKFLIPTVGVAVLVGALFFTKNNSSTDVLLCPSEYPTTEAATASFQAFSDNYYAEHPNADASGMLEARIDFYISHRCTQELEAYRQAQAGTADPATMERIDKAIRESM